MGSHFKFAAIYQTSLLERAPRKVVCDPVKIEFFKGPRVLDVPLQVSRITPFGREAPIAGSGKLALNDGPFISITVRTDESDPFKAKRFCEDQLDSALAQLAVIYDPALFSEQIYRGWLLEEKKWIMEAWVQRKNPIAVSSDLADALSEMRKSVSQVPELHVRFLLMSRFLAKSLLVSPGEEKFLYLWTMLEIFPMKDTSNIAPISDYVGTLVNRPPAEVKEKLGIGRLYGSRCTFVHDGRLDIPLSDLGLVFGRLELICIEVLRSLCGLPYSGSLENYFDAKGT